MVVSYVCVYCDARYTLQDAAMQCERRHTEHERYRAEAFARLKPGTLIRYFDGPGHVVSGVVRAHFGTRLIIEAAGVIHRPEADYALACAEEINGVHT